MKTFFTLICGPGAVLPQRQIFFLLKIFILLLLQGHQLIFQETRDLFEPAYFETQKFAHRGGYFSGPENTIPTILSNLSNGVTSIEIDLRLTADNKLILFHDENIRRLLNTSHDLPVSKLTLQEIRNIALKNNKANAGINTLEELLDTLSVFIPAHRVEHFLLELDFKPHGKKTEKAVDELLILLEKYEEVYGVQIYQHLFVSSFYPEVLKVLHKRNSNIKTAFAINDNPPKNKLMAKFAVALAPAMIRKYGVDIIEPNMCMVTEAFVKKWHKRGVLINAYTANTQCEKEHLEQFNIAYTTNCPLGYCKGDPGDELGPPTKWCKKCHRKENR